MVVLEFIGLLLTITFAAYMLSRGAEVLAEKWGVNVVGSLILALVTTLPEYSFVFWASMKEQYRVAIGSAIGACTLLITLGYGLVIVLATSRFSRKPVNQIILSKTTRVDAGYLFITAVVAFFFVWHDNALSVWEGLGLTLVFLGYGFQIIHAANRHCSIRHEVTKKAVVWAFIQLVAGGAIVYVCSEPFVDSMIEFAKMIGISPVVIAIVIGPIASEMPEKLTAYMVVMRNGANAELSICNFLGSKVNHNSLLLALMPFVAYSKGKGEVTGLMSANFLIMTALTVLVTALLATGRVYRWHGWVLVGCYIGAMTGAVLYGG